MATRGSTEHDLGVRRALIVLCVTEFLAWGALYYMLPVAIEDVAADTGWTRSSISFAFSAGLVLSALLAAPVGWILERRGPRVPMCVGSVLVVPSILLMAGAHSYVVFIAGWLLCGLSMATLFYQAAFTAVTGWMGKDRVRGLTAVTLAGGVSSTGFAPLVSVLTDHFGWRTTFVAVGCAVAVILLPLHYFFLTPTWTPVVKGAAGAPDVGPTIRSRQFIVLAASVTAFVFAGFAVHITVVSLMTEAGYTARFGAIVLAVIGVGQLFGRLAFSRYGAQTAMPVRNLTIVLSMLAATAAIAAIPGPAAILLAVAVVLGAARGAGTLMHATMVADIWGTARYGALAGVFSVPVTLATALAPWSAAAIADAMGSYQAMDLAMAGLVGLAAVGIFVAGRPRPEPAQPPDSSASATGSGSCSASC